MPKTYFYQDGEKIIYCEEAEADRYERHIKNGRNQFKFLGCSDGQTFHNMIYQPIRKANSKKLELHNRLQSGDISIEEHDELVGKITEEYAKHFQEALNAELEIAKKNQERPRDLSMEVLGGSLRGITSKLLK